MTCLSDSTGATTGDRSHDGRRNGQRCGGNWSGLNIAAMVVGFVLFWPVGLFLLFWNITGGDVKELPDVIRGLWSRIDDAWRGNVSDSRSTTENGVFNEFPAGSVRTHPRDQGRDQETCAAIPRLPSQGEASRR